MEVEMTMWSWLLVIGVIALFAGLAWFTIWNMNRKAVWHLGNPRDDTALKAQQAIIDSLTVQTPPKRDAFPFVLSQVPIHENVRQGIIDGFADVTARAKAKGWLNGFDPSQYTVMLFPSVRDHDADGTYSPVFQVFFKKGTAYDNSIYDQVPNAPGGWIFAAEQVLTTANQQTLKYEPTNVFMIAMNDQRDYTARVVSYGLEHILSWKNDPAFYEATKDHSGGGVHPLF